MRKRTTWTFSAAALGFAVATAILAGPASAAPAAPRALASSHAQTAASSPGRLYGIAATSAGNAWAVGISDTQAIILRWNGSIWRQVFGSAGPVLFSVAASSAGNAWAVGGTDWWHPQPYILHWNGSTWVRVPSPAMPRDSHFRGVTATSASNAWAVGVVGGGIGLAPRTRIRTLIEHWNGRAWARVPSPTIRPDSWLNSVTATSASNAWAVGWTGRGPDGESHAKTLIEHWNGQAWTIVPSPSAARVSTELKSVTAISAGNVWAAGLAGRHSNPRTYMLHWNGSTWSRVHTPTPPGGGWFESVAASGPRDAWAVGDTVGWGGVCSPACQTLAEHWNGHAWTLVPAPNPPSSYLNDLLGVAAIAPGDAWAVGTTDFVSTLTMHWDGTAWTTW